VSRGAISTLTRASEEQARLSRELATGMLVAQEEERRRVARELHDETIQALSTLLVNLDHVEHQIAGHTGDSRAAFERLREIVRRTLDETRALAQALRPTVLDDLGLAAALETLADECRQTYDLRPEIETDLVVAERLPAEVEIAIFRVAQEALKNTSRHAHATRAHVRLSCRTAVARLTVEDDGKGFVPDQTGRERQPAGLGLSGMRERAALLGGTLTIESAPGVGTCIALDVPIDRPSDDPGVVPERVVRAHDDSSPDIRVLLVDDHAMFREGLVRILGAWPGIRVVGEAADGRQAIELVEQLQPDVVVMDIAMPNLNGLDATRQISRRFPDVRVVILTTYESRQYLVQIVKVGAAACVLKRSAGTELLAAVQAAAQGESYVSPTIAGMMLDDYRLRIDHCGDDMLTEREREVLQLIVEGRTNQEIADELIVSIKTVQTHRAHILRKLGAHDRADLVKHAISTGMIPSETL
jgi:DNA-binding NarL/FixJ family response regulator/two-component sensor histidine kinase